MVKYEPDLDTTFLTLADPTRRHIVERLAQGRQLAVSELARPFAMSLPGVLKHVNILCDAGLVVREKQGRTVYCRLEAEPMRSAMQWLEHYEKFWSERLDALAALVEESPCPSPPSPASRSAASSKPRRSASSKPGRGRKT